MSTPLPPTLPEQTVWINGRFLERKITGVERVARELLNALSKLLDADGIYTIQTDTGLTRRLRFRLIAPLSSQKAVPQSPWSNIPLVHRGRGSGHLWEQTALAWHTRHELLISLCNTGPMLKREHIIFLHDAQPFAIAENFTFAFRTWYKLLFNLAGRTSRAVLTNSHFSKAELVRHTGLPADKITVAWLGADHILQLTPDETILERHQLPRQAYLFAVASLNPNKNFTLVLQALALLGTDAPPCVIAGQRYEKVFEGIAFDESKVTHVGYVTDAELCALYRHANALLFPSFYEGFGLPPVEAMLLGCPAIVSNTSVMPEINADAALYCDPHSPDSLAQAISKLQKNPILREQFRTKGLDRAKTFTWQATAHTILQEITKHIPYPKTE